jgi:hypothetical protein
MSFQDCREVSHTAILRQDQANEFVAFQRCLPNP